MLSQVLFAPERLALVDGVHSRKIYIAILGHMFDVTLGAQHYGEPLHNGGGASCSFAFFQGETSSVADFIAFGAAALTSCH